MRKRDFVMLFIGAILTTSFFVLSSFKEKEKPLYFFLTEEQQAISGTNNHRIVTYNKLYNPHPDKFEEEGIKFISGITVDEFIRVEQEERREDYFTINTLDPNNGERKIFRLWFTREGSLFGK